MRIGAVIVLYHPVQCDLYALIQSVSQQVSCLSIVDNSKTPSLTHLMSGISHYHHFPSNRGIAAGQNIGLIDLVNDKCDFGLLLDQDSKITATFIKQLVDKITQHNKNNNELIAIGPRVVCSFSEKEVRPKVQRELKIMGNLSFVSQIISSGMMISLDKFSLVGMKEEGLFIDGVDHEWCWRAQQQNFKVAIADDVSMVHTLGDSRNSFLGVSYKVGSPIRLYYQFRNILILSRRNYVPQYWKVRNLCAIPVRMCLNVLFENSKRQRLRYMMHGLRDGLRGKYGPYE